MDTNTNILFDNYIFNNDSIYDILNATVNTELLKGVADSMLEFKDTSTIILYTSLNKTNTELLQNKQYTKFIKAFEYSEMALGINESECIIKLAYNTKGLYDTLHPLAYTEIERYIQENKLKKSAMQDMQLIKELLKSYTGVRVHSLDYSKKSYTNTHIFFNNSKLAYILNPNYIEILDIRNK